MADKLVQGFWKGLAVTQTNRITVNIYFEDDEGKLGARFEAADDTHDPVAGDLEVLLVGTELTMMTSVSDETVWFTGAVHGETGGPQVIHGLIYDPRFELLAGSLTLFSQKKPKPDVPLMYRGSDPTE